MGTALSGLEERAKSTRELAGLVRDGQAKYNSSRLRKPTSALLALNKVPRMPDRADFQRDALSMSRRPKEEEVFDIDQIACVAPMVTMHRSNAEDAGETPALTSYALIKHN